MIKNLKILRNMKLSNIKIEFQFLISILKPKYIIQIITKLSLN